MTLDYTVCGQVRITILSYIEEILTIFRNVDPKCKGNKSSSTPKNIFVVNEDCKKPDQGKVVEFHNLVAKTLYNTKRAKPYTCTDIAFLKTRI